MSRALWEMTTSFMSCTWCRQREEHRGVLTEPWQPPRGWAGALSDRSTRELLFVSHNPGHPLDDGTEVAFCETTFGWWMTAETGRRGQQRRPRQTDAGVLLTGIRRSRDLPGLHLPQGAGGHRRDRGSRILRGRVGGEAGLRGASRDQAADGRGTRAIDGERRPRVRVRADWS